MNSIKDLIKIPIDEELKKYVEAYRLLKNMNSEDYIEIQVRTENDLKRYKEKIKSESTKKALVLCIRYLYLERYKYFLYGERYEDEGREIRKQFENFFIELFSNHLNQDYISALKDEINFDSTISTHINQNAKPINEKSILPSTLISITYEIGRHTYLRHSYPSKNKSFLDWHKDVLLNDSYIRKLDWEIENESKKIFKSKSTIEYLEQEKKKHIENKNSFCSQISKSYSEYQNAFDLIENIRDSYGEIKTLELILECRDALKNKVQLKHLLLEKGFELAELNSYIK